MALLETLLELGFQGLWVHDAKVRHFIPAERLTANYVWRWFSGYGKTVVRQNHALEGPRRTEAARLFGVPRWMLRRFVQSYLLSCLLSPLKSSLWVKYYLNAAICRGMMHECKTLADDAFRQREPRHDPLISVGMPVYNGAAHLAAAIESIWRKRALISS